MRSRRLTGLIVAFWLTASMVPAAVVPGRWEKVEALAEGSELLVTTFGQGGVLFRWRGFEGDSLVVTDTNQAELRIPRTGVERIETAHKVRDGRRDGTLIGAAAGFAAGFLGLAAFNAHKTASGSLWGGEAPGFYLSAGVLGMGAGAVAGYVIDSAVEHREVLYRAPAAASTQAKQMAALP
jgi:hypothetical protein